MEASRGWELDKSLLHVIDREADSVDYFRKWDAAGFKFLVRADDRRVQWSGKSVLLSEIRRSLTRREAFHKVTDEASYHGKAAQLWVAETHVILNRPARKNVKGNVSKLPDDHFPCGMLWSNSVTGGEKYWPSGCC